MPNFDVLGEMIRNIHAVLSQLFFVAMPLGIIISVIVGYFKAGTPDYVDILRRALIASLLLTSFPEVSNLILKICDGVAAKIDTQSGIDQILRLAQEKSQNYSTTGSALLLKFDDLIIAILSFLSFLILYIARYLTIALYYFFWTLLSVLSPILIFLYLFPATESVTKNLYRGLIEVASWKIIWSIQSAMLISLSLGNIYKTEGHYLTLIVLNFVIAIGMIFTPMIVKSISGEGAQGAAFTIGASAMAVMGALPAKTALMKAKVQTVGQSVKSSFAQKYQNYQQRKQDKQNLYRY